MKKIAGSLASPVTVCILAFFLQGNGHAGAQDGGNIVYPSRAGMPGPVVFSHRFHGSGGAGYECSRCHEEGTGRESGNAGEIRGKNFCGSCHDGKSAGPGKKSPAVILEDCSSCHMPVEEVVIRLNRMDPVHFSHLKHFGIVSAGEAQKHAGFACGDCHPEPFEKDAKARIEMELPHVKGGCAQCHDGQSRSVSASHAFAADTRCLTCHRMPGADGGRPLQ